MPKQKKQPKQKKAQSKPQPARAGGKTVENPPKTSAERFPGNTW
jgi:hypothetical protein